MRRLLEKKEKNNTTTKVIFVRLYSAVYCHAIAFLYVLCSVCVLCSVVAFCMYARSDRDARGHSSFLAFVFILCSPAVRSYHVLHMREFISSLPPELFSFFHKISLCFSKTFPKNHEFIFHY